MHKVNDIPPKMAPRSNMPSQSPPSATSATFSSRSSAGTPSSVFSNSTTTSLLSAVDSVLTKGGDFPDRSELTISSKNGSWDIVVSPEEKKIIIPHAESFPAAVGRVKSKETLTSSSIVVATSFLEYLLGNEIPNEVLQIVLIYFERDFLSADLDIHSHALGLEAQHQGAQANLLKTYYAALRACNKQGVPPNSALFQAAQNGEAHMYAVFGGQGVGNMTCLRDLSYLYSLYRMHLDDLLDVASSTLNKLIESPKAAYFYERLGFDIKKWLKQPKTMPTPAYFAAAPLSFPINGLLSLAHYAIACKTLGKHPGEVRNSLQGLSGHSQGIVIAAAIARSGSWADFYDSTALALEILFWVGFESHHAAPTSTLTPEDNKDSIVSGEGPPSPMLGIRGLDRTMLQRFIDETNHHVPHTQHIYLALVNSRDNFVVSGPPKTLRSLNLRLRKIKADEKLDQSQIPYKQRKIVLLNRFLPISAPFHSPHLEKSVNQVMKALEYRSFTGSDLRTSVFSTLTGGDLKARGVEDLIEPLVRMIMTNVVEWPRASSSFLGATHIVDFGPGRIGMLQNQLTEGTGVRNIIASDLTSVAEGIGSKEELFQSTLRPLPQNWTQVYSPRLMKDMEGEMRLNTKMTRLFGTPPVMVAGMTPITAPWDVVSAIMNAGYHVELAGGGYWDPSMLKKAVQDIVKSVPVNRGITINCVYLDSGGLAAQIGPIRQFIQEGLPIEGLTMAAGIPPPELIKEMVETVGLKHISFKPKSYSAILEVLKIAKSYPEFSFGLQWIGGRSGGHHSCEDFHEPILKAYGQVRECSNVVLIAGSGFGGAEDTYPYITGEWSEDLDLPLMPFDGVLLGSRMMIAKEAHLSTAAKKLIALAEGTTDDEWSHSFDEAAGGVISVKNELGGSMHKIATRGVLLWHDLDKEIFSIKDKTEQVAAMQKRRIDIIWRLNRDFQKPWFAVDWSGQNVELEDMTYLEVLHRLITLMYVRHEKRWIDPSYMQFTKDFVSRIVGRLVMLSPFAQEVDFSEPFSFLDDFSCCYPGAEDIKLSAEDADFFVELCKRVTQKPINFIPRLDENFEAWFKRDALWQAADLEAVIDQDIQRTCIIHGPVAAQYSKQVDEPCKDILDGIANAFVDRLCEEINSTTSDVSANAKDSNTIPTQDLDDVTTEELPGKRIYTFSGTGTVPDVPWLISHLSNNFPGWAQACLGDKSLVESHRRTRNPIKAAFKPQPGDMVTVTYGDSGAISSVSLANPYGSSEAFRTSLRLSSVDGKHINVTLLVPSPRGGKEISLEFRFEYAAEKASYKLKENTVGRNEKIRMFYVNLWLGHYPASLSKAGLHDKFTAGKVALSRKMVQDFLTVIGRGTPDFCSHEPFEDNCVPLDFCIVIAWNSLVQPLLIPALGGDRLRILHRSNEFEYYPGAEPIRLGDVLETVSHIEGVAILPTGKLVEVVADIRKGGDRIVKVTAAFLILGSSSDPFQDYENTFKTTEEPEIEVDVSSEGIQDLLLGRKWLDVEGEPELVGSTVVFRLKSRATFNIAGKISTLQVTGHAYSKNAAGIIMKLGNVYYQAGASTETPVMDFLYRYGAPTTESQPLNNAVWKGNSSLKMHIPHTNGPYAHVSKDTNPIHTSAVFALYANFPGVITHGMYTAAAVRRLVEKSSLDAKSIRFRRYAASFDDLVFPGDDLRVEMQHMAMIDDRMLLKIQAFNDQTNERVLNAEAEIEHHGEGDRIRRSDISLVILDASKLGAGKYSAAVFKMPATNGHRIHK